MNDFWFATFGDSRLKQSIMRIRRQAHKMKIFEDRIRVLTDSDLDADFKEKMRNYLVPGSKGFGYWCWKPQVILQVLNEMQEGDVLLYTDIGCHLNPKGLDRLEDYRQLAIRHGIVGFQFRALGDKAITDYNFHYYYEKQWTKMDLFVYFNALSKEILNSGQVQACVMVIHNVPSVRQLIEKWRSCYYEHFELVDDTPSKEVNDVSFIENRHDQSVFSLLCKLNNACLLSCGEIEQIRSHMPSNGDKRLWPEYWRELASCPVHARRDLGKYTTLVACPDWLKPILGKRGRRIASKVYDSVKSIFKG